MCKCKDLTEKCCKCGWDKVRSNGAIALCQCDLKEVYTSSEAIRKIKFPKKGYAAKDIFKSAEEFDFSLLTKVKKK